MFTLFNINSISNYMDQQKYTNTMQLLQSKPDYNEEIIKVTNIHKTYLLGVEGVAALRGVTFQIFAGEFIIILGNSGGGKTTLLNILGTIDKPTKGHLMICGQKIKSNTNDQILSGLRLNHLGFVFQTFNLISSLTAQQNVELPMVLKGELTKEQVSTRAVELLTSVGMEHRLNHYPNQLSGGEQQRVTIARALSNHPKILLLDEPTGDLDSKNTDNVLKILLNLNIRNKITLIMVTHDVNLKYYSHRVLRVLDGKIIKQEKIDEKVREQSIRNLMHKIQQEKQEENDSELEKQIKNQNQVGKISQKSPEQYSAVSWLRQKRKREQIQKQIAQRLKQNI